MVRNPVPCNRRQGILTTMQSPLVNLSSGNAGGPHRYTRMDNASLRIADVRMYANNCWLTRDPPSCLWTGVSDETRLYPMKALAVEGVHYYQRQRRNDTASRCSAAPEMYSAVTEATSVSILRPVRSPWRVTMASLDCEIAAWIWIVRSPPLHLQRSVGRAS